MLVTMLRRDRALRQRRKSGRSVRLFTLLFVLLAVALALAAIGQGVAGNS